MIKLPAHLLGTLILITASVYATVSAESVLSAQSIIPTLSLLLLDDSMPYNISMITPYQGEAKIASINEAYSEPGADPPPPWGFAHTKIGFFPTEDLVEFQAVAAGTVGRIEKHGSEGQVNVDIKYNETFGVGYAFEPRSAADGDRQWNNIVVGVGQKVAPGDIVGRLVKPSSDIGAHVHFGLFIDHEQKCPEQYFKPQAHASIMRILVNQWGSEAKMCYLAN